MKCCDVLSSYVAVAATPHSLDAPMLLVTSMFVITSANDNNSTLAKSILLYHASRNITVSRRPIHSRVNKLP